MFDFEEVLALPTVERRYDCNNAPTINDLLLLVARVLLLAFPERSDGNQYSYLQPTRCSDILCEHIERPPTGTGGFLEAPRTGFETVTYQCSNSVS